MAFYFIMQVWWVLFHPVGENLTATSYTTDSARTVPTHQHHNTPNPQSLIPRP